MPNENNNVAPQAPQINESEMKLPEEQFGGAATIKPASTHAINPLLIGLLVILLLVLGAVILWGEAIIGMILPETKVELPPLPEAAETQNEDASASPDENGASSQTEADLNAIETDMSELDKSMNEMDAEIETAFEAEAE